ncbi:DUF6527 family protein [Aureisphaera sp.]
MPDQIEEGTVYISLEYGAVIHLCACGCGEEVNTPLSPTDWKLAYDGKNISLFPSIGNWSFKCRSHYWIEDSEVVWAKTWSESRIKRNRTFDKRIKSKYYGSTEKSVEEKHKSKKHELTNCENDRKGFWDKFRMWLNF